MPDASQGNPRLRRTATWVAIVYFVAMAIALTFPGIIPFNTIRPFVLGIPFVFAWYIAWLLGALCVFGFLDKVFRE
jgi:hypothetical protein